MQNRSKIFSDPIHGFISIPRGLLYHLIQEPIFQRLRRIRQLGVGYKVFPGAEHTRFGHALGAMALTQDALKVISDKGTPISQEEETACLAAILLHDLGHGPFSHTLEHSLIKDFHHESMSLSLMDQLAEKFGPEMALARDMFSNVYPRPFFHQLISGQLDMDRLDYLRRDAFYTGVSEGVVGIDRIIKTLRVDPIEGNSNSTLVVEEKGVYAIENFLVARRLMYWQVYLHKTVLAGDFVLESLFKRVRDLGSQIVDGAENLLYFLKNDWNGDDSQKDELVEMYSSLDDVDVLYSLKQWQNHPDPILSNLALRFLNRDFFRVHFLKETPSKTEIETWTTKVDKWLDDQGLGADSRDHYFQILDSTHSAYVEEKSSILILTRDGKRVNIEDMIDHATVIPALTKPVLRPYVCYPKEIKLELN